jgi:hypothetical protein
MHVVPLDKAIHAEIELELEIAKGKYGLNRFEVLCIESGWGDTLDDSQALRLVRALNRTGSMFWEVIGRS